MAILAPYVRSSSSRRSTRVTVSDERERTAESVDVEERGEAERVEDGGRERQEREMRSPSRTLSCSSGWRSSPDVTFTPLSSVVLSLRTFPLRV